MIDINTLINNVLAEAVQQATAPLVARINALETKLAEGADIQAAPTADITRHIIDALSDTDHPLFKRMSSFMDTVAEQAVENHCQTYDHDEYDGHIGDDDKHFDGDINDAINDALSNASISISV